MKQKHIRVDLTQSMDESWMQCPLEDSSVPTKRQRCREPNDWMKPALEDRPQAAAASSQDDWMKPPLEEAATNKKMQISSAPAKICVNVSLALLKLLPADFTKETAYSRNGKSLERIGQQLKHACRSCSQNCGKQFTAKQVSALVDAWYKLSSISQQQVLFGLFHPEPAVNDAEQHLTGAAIAKKRCWQLDGQTVCFDKFCSLLGHTPRTILRMVHGDEDMRKMLPSRPRPHPQQDLIMHFFLELYMTTAEQLPEMDQETTAGLCDGTPAEDSLPTKDRFSNSWILETPGPERIQALPHTEI